MPPTLPIEPMTPRHRRPEALPFSWSQLTEKQKAAVGVVAELLLDALDSLAARGTSRPEALDRNRRSQIAFIDGDRGMGKSSVLLSIQDLILSDKRKEDALEDTSPICEMILRRKELVLLETLDMEPLPRTANILAAILTRIEAKIPFLDDRQRLPRMAIFNEKDNYERIVMHLRELQSTAVRAWTGIAPLRATRIDPTAYSDEVLQSEKGGLDLNRRLGELLDEVAKLIETVDGKRNPIFILPIDDFDLAPSRCLELLRIIRMVATPRLFFLVAGNTRIAEDVLRLQCQGELAALAGDPMATIEAAVIRERSIEIAANNLRKLVPPAQRAQLRVLRVDEALKFRLDAEDRTLDGVLESITFDRNNAPPNAAPTTLKEFMLPGAGGSRVHYSAAKWLGGTPRQVLDRTAALSRHEGFQNDLGEGLLTTLCEELGHEIHEDGRLSYDHRELLSNLVDVSEDIRFDFARIFHLEVRAEEWNDVPFDGGIKRLRFPESTRWLFKGASQPQESQRTWPVPRQTAAGMAFLHDLAKSLWGGYVPPHEFNNEIRPASPLAAVLWGSLPEAAAVRWHIPGWWTLREYERFYAHWNAHAAKRTETFEYAAAWLMAQLEVLMDKKIERKDEIDFARLGALLESLAGEEPLRHARQYLRESALVTTCLLLAPESGVSSDFTQNLIKAAGKLFGPSALIDGNVAARVHSWRVQTFVSVQNAIGQTTPPHILDQGMIKLCSALCAEKAADLAWENLKRELARAKQYGEYRAPEKSQRSLEDVASDRKSRKRIAELEDQLKVLTSEECPLYLRSAIEIAIIALKPPYKAHPFNSLFGGQLVVNRREIEAFSGELRGEP